MAVTRTFVEEKYLPDIRALLAAWQSGQGVVRKALGAYLTSLVKEALGTVASTGNVGYPLSGVDIEDADTIVFWMGWRPDEDVDKAFQWSINLKTGQVHNIRFQ